MNDAIIDQIKKICFQLKIFLRTNHRFDDLVFVDTKNFVFNIIKEENSSITSKSSRKIRSSRFSKNFIWFQIWAINRNKFKKAIISFEKTVDLLFNFSKAHSRESFKSFINFQFFVSSKLILSVSFSSLIRAFISIANQILSAREQSSSSLISISSDVENSVNARNFDFTFRSYESFDKVSDSMFSLSNENSKTSSFEHNRADSVVDFIENSQSLSIALTSASNIMNFAKSVFILQFVLHKSAFSTHSAKITLNSKSSFSKQFSSRSITSESDKQTIRTTVKYEISRNIFVVDSASASTNSSSSDNMTQEFTETQRRELMTMMQEFWTQRSINSISQSTQQSQTMKFKSNRWIVSKLDFFDSTYERKFTFTDDFMQHAEKNTYFRNVHFFIDRVKNIIVIKKSRNSSK